MITIKHITSAINKRLRYFCAFAVLLSFLVTSPVTARAETQEASGKITLFATGSVAITPDIAYISVGDSFTSRDSVTGRNKGEEKIAAMTAAFAALGVPAEDIVTECFAVTPNYVAANDKNYYDFYDYDQLSSLSGFVFDGYWVDFMLTVKVRDLDLVWEIVDQIMGSFTGFVDDVTFTVENPEDYYIEALAAAMAEAEKKAKTITSAFEASSFRPVDITEAYYNTAQPVKTQSADDFYYSIVNYGKTSDFVIFICELEIKATLQIIYEYY